MPTTSGPTVEPPPRADFATIDPDDLDCLDDLHRLHLGSITRPTWLTGQSAGPLSGAGLLLAHHRPVRDQVGDEVSVHGEVFSPFTHFHGAVRLRETR